MSHLRAVEKAKAKAPARLHMCNVCGFVGPWSPKWASYSSLLIDDYDNRLALRVCSDKCAKILTAKLKSGKIALPVLSHHGDLSELKKPQVGYGRQPTQDELHAKWTGVES